jgi:hypothetical protein
MRWLQPEGAPSVVTVLLAEAGSARSAKAAEKHIERTGIMQLFITWPFVIILNGWIIRFYAMKSQPYSTMRQ